MFFIQNVTYIGSVGYRHTACSREIVHREGHTLDGYLVDEYLNDYQIYSQLEYSST